MASEGTRWGHTGDGRWCGIRDEFECGGRTLTHMRNAECQRKIYWERIKFRKMKGLQIKVIFLGVKNKNLTNEEFYFNQIEMLYIYWIQSPRPPWFPRRALTA